MTTSRQAEGSLAGDSRYLQIAEALQQEIERLGPNTLLETEERMARRFGVSRVTVRRALGLLERSGLVSRQRGRGTSVSPPKITRHLLPLYTFDDDLRQQGITVETQLLACEPRCIPPEVVRRRLQLRPGSSTCFLSLVRLVEGRVISHDRRYIPRAFAKGLAPQLATTRPISEVLTGLAGQSIATVDWESEIVPSSREIATALRITPGVLVVENVFTEYLEDGVPVQAGVMAYRIDRVRFRFSAQGAYEKPGAARTTASSLAGSKRAGPPMDKAK